MAEAVGRSSWKDGNKFLFYARGSLVEAQHGVRRAARQRFITAEVLEALREDFVVLAKQLNAFINSQGPEAAKSAETVQEDAADYGDLAF
ncbi:MAG TPA: four helix bundle protein [Planctomycetota bacterium]|nr:four helix bundle protein [Planctomycetota bacterium]